MHSKKSLSFDQYGKIGSKVVLLLSGGDKSSQSRDIVKAKEYLKDYPSNERGLKGVRPAILQFA